MPNGCPKHHTRWKALMLVLNASRQHADSSEPPDMHTTIRIMHAEPGLVWKENIMPFLYPALSFGTPELPSLSMLHCQLKPKYWSPRWQAAMLQTSVHCMSESWTFCKHVHFLTNGLWCDYMILKGWSHNMFVLLGISHGIVLRSCMPFSMTLSNTLIPYSHDSG